MDISRACGFVAKGKDSSESVPAVTQCTAQTNTSPSTTLAGDRDGQKGPLHGMAEEPKPTRYISPVNRGEF